MALTINPLGGLRKIPDRPMPTLPKVQLPDVDDHEIEEAARAVAERKVIRAGIDAWHALGKADSWEAWKTICRALQVGRDYALKSTGANRPAGRAYCAAFNAWLQTHRFDMEKSLRFAALKMIEHLPEIEQWRSEVGEKRRAALTNPVSNLRAWRRETGQTKTKCAGDALKAAEIAWRRFVACVEALPADQAAPLWRLVQAMSAFEGKADMPFCAANVCF
jgi:hypothetical protein